MKNLSQITEEKVLLRSQKEKSAVLTFGRFQPPTIGHEKLVDAVLSVSKKLGADAFVFPSRTQDKKKNPLSAKDKVYFLRKSFKKVEVVDNANVDTVFNALYYLRERGYTKITLVVGGDRVAEFKKTITPYLNHKDPKKSLGIDPSNFDIVSAGERDPDATDVTGMSASKMRAAVANNDYDTFVKGVPSRLGKADANKLFNTLKANMGIKEEVEPQEVVKKSDVKVVVFSGFNSKNPDNYMLTARRIKEECDSMGVECFVAFFPECNTIKNKDGTITIINRDGKEFIADTKNTVIVVRGSNWTSGTLNIITSFEKEGFFVVNPRDSIETCGDKYRTYLSLLDENIPTPKTALITKPEKVMEIHKKVGGKFPVVVKTIRGSKGKGVFIVESEKSLKSSVEAIEKIDKDQELIIQEFIPINHDFRVIVLNGKVIAAMKRTSSTKKEFRTNYSLGGSVAKVVLEKDIEQIAVKAARAVGCYYAGVDIAISKKTGKPYVLEVNSSPGSEGVEKATGKNIIRKFVKSIIKKRNWVHSPIVVGTHEVVEIEGIGDITAKFDTGNGTVTCLHADSFVIKGDTVIWHFNGKKFRNKKMGTVKIKQGAGQPAEERPVIELVMTFLNKKYRKLFSLDDRSNKSASVLVGVPFMTDHRILVDPARKYIKTSPLEEAVDPTIEGTKGFLDRYKKKIKKVDFTHPPEEGTDEIVRRYKDMTPGEMNEIANDYFGI